MLIILASLLLFGAQDRPNMSGTWSAQVDPAARPAPILVYGPEFTVDHKAQAFAVQRVIGGMKATIPHVLDGTETTSRMPGRLCMPDSGAAWTAAWEGNAISIRMIRTTSTRSTTRTIPAQDETARSIARMNSLGG